MRGNRWEEEKEERKYLWAMVTVVRPSEALSMASWTIFSDSESSADVASSNNNNFGFLISARAYQYSLDQHTLYRTKNKRKKQERKKAKERNEREKWRKERKEDKKTYNSNTLFLTTRQLRALVTNTSVITIRKRRNEFVNVGHIGSLFYFF